MKSEEFITETQNTIEYKVFQRSGIKGATSDKTPHGSWSVRKYVNGKESSVVKSGIKTKKEADALASSKKGTVNETTCAGGIATVVSAQGSAQTRNASIYGTDDTDDKKKKKSKKTAKYVNSKQD